MDLNQDPPSPQNVILPIKLISPLLFCTGVSDTLVWYPASPMALLNKLAYI